jgi:hypothetical protein
VAALDRDAADLASQPGVRDVDDRRRGTGTDSPSGSAIAVSRASRARSTARVISPSRK